MPKVSVLMTNYNGEAFIERAIESILRQTFTDFEFIIIDDGSTDKSWSIIQRYSYTDMRIICYQNTENLGISKTRNRLIDLATGNYLAWLDSDDSARRDRLDKQIEFLDNHPQHGIVGSWMMLIDATGNKIGSKKLPINDKEIRQQWYFRNSLNHPSLMMRKICIEKTGYYDPRLDGAEDYDFGTRVGTHCLLANIPEELTEYRIHNNNASIKKQKIIIQKTLLVRKKMTKIGYPMGIGAHICYHITWVMQFIPSRVTVFLFYSFIKLFPVKKNSAK